MKGDVAQRPTYPPITGKGSMTRRQLLLPSLIALSVFACVGPTDDTESTEDGLTKFGGLVEGSDEACAVRRVANEAAEQALDADVGLDKRAAKNIVSFRAGADGKVGTE